MPPGGANNSLKPCLRAVQGFIGITDVQFIYAHSLNAGNPAGPSAIAESPTILSRLAQAA